MPVPFFTHDALKSPLLLDPVAIARRAMLGVNLSASESNGGGVRIVGVSPGGPAAEAGVKPGEKVELGLMRDGKPLKLAVEARPIDHTLSVGTPGVLAVRPLPPLPPLPALSAVAAMPMDGDLHWLLEDWGDAELVTMTPGLGHYFGADKGVLVARAPEDASLGLKDGDVIVAIGGREPQNGRHAMRILRSYQPGESVELRILRDHKTQTLSAKVPEREARDVMMRQVAPPRPPAVPAPIVPPPSESASAT